METLIRNMHNVESFTKSIMISELECVDRSIGVNFQQECTWIALTLVDLISKASKSDFAGGQFVLQPNNIRASVSVSADSRWHRKVQAVASPVSIRWRVNAGQA